MNRMKAIVTGSLLGLSLLLGAGQPAYAVGVMGQWNNTWTPPPFMWTRGSTPETLYAEWNVFNNETPGMVTILDTTPDVANFGGGTYRLSETSGNGYVHSSGNIWQSGVATPPPLSFQLVVTPPAGQGGPGLVRDFHMRLATMQWPQSTSPAPRHTFNVTLNGVRGSHTRLFEGPFSGPPYNGNEIEDVVSWWGVPHATRYELNWLVSNNPGVLVGLDQLSIDVGQPVPLPAAAYLMASGLVGLAAMARRKQRAV